MIGSRWSLQHVALFLLKTCGEGSWAVLAMILQASSRCAVKTEPRVRPSFAAAGLCVHVFTNRFPVPSSNNSCNVQPATQAAGGAEWDGWRDVLPCAHETQFKHRNVILVGVV